MYFRFRLAQSSFLARFLAALCLSQAAPAAQVVITITGTVASGDDMTGVFGPPNSDLTGDTFTLVFTFDDTKGTQKTATCGGGVPYETSITSTPTSNPGTATLTIGGKSFTFGVLNASYEANSQVIRSYASTSTCSADSFMTLSVGDGYLENGSGLNGNVYPADGTILTSNPNWEAPFSDSNLDASPNTDATISFEIRELPTSGQYVSDGWLIPQTITVSGPEREPGICLPGLLPLRGPDPRRELTPLAGQPTRRVEATIDTTDPAPNGQPNLLQLQDITQIAVTIRPGAAIPVMLTNTNTSYGTIAPNSLTTDVSGDGIAMYTGGAQTGNDMVTATVSASCADSVSVYDYDDTLSFTWMGTHHGPTAYNFHQSQVSASVFSPSTQPLTAVEIQSFITTNFPSSMLANFYIDSTNLGSGGWYDPGVSNVSEKYSAIGPTAITYCTGPNVGDCPAPDDTGTLAAVVIYEAALYAYSTPDGSGTPGMQQVSDEVVLATLQKESGLVQGGALANTGAGGYFTGYTTTPVTGATLTLNNAMGAVSPFDFGDQLATGADTLISRYNDPVAYFNNSLSLSWPFLWPVSTASGATGMNASIQYPYQSSAQCVPGSKNVTTYASGCTPVSVYLNDAQTYAQYEYTPFVKVFYSGGGGVEGFEQQWFQYVAIGW